MLSHLLTARGASAGSGGQCVSVIASRWALELRPDEKCSLNRGRQLDQFSRRCSTCSVMFDRSSRISLSGHTAA
jgi:hypothetical protein